LFTTNSHGFGILYAEGKAMLEFRQKTENVSNNSAAEDAQCQVSQDKDFEKDFGNGIEEDTCRNLLERVSNNLEGDNRDWLRWSTISKEKLTDCKVFSVSKVHSASLCPEKKRGNFYTLDCNDWVNVIALSDDGNVLMVEQFRHGVEDLTLELPGGSSEKYDESPLIAARRELKEETGYEAGEWIELGKNHPNPALQNNLCYTYLARQLNMVEEPRFDETGTERIVSRWFSLPEIEEAIRNGKISHSLVITAFHFLALHRNKIF